MSRRSILSCGLKLLSRGSNFFSRWSNIFFSWFKTFSRGSNMFRGSDFSCGWSIFFLKGEKVLFFLSKAIILFLWINLGYFDRPRWDQGVRKVTYLLRLVKLGVSVTKNLRVLGNHGK